LGLRRTARAARLVHHRRELRRLEGLGRRAAVLVGHAKHHVGTGAEALGHGLVQLQRHVHRRGGGLRHDLALGVQHRITTGLGASGGQQGGGKKDDVFHGAIVVRTIMLIA
jgi:hypothetical protein